MHIFKTSTETYGSVIKNQKHAFKTMPKDLYPGDIVVLSKNKSGLSENEKQISHYAILKKIRKCSDEEIELLWPGNSGRWNYITEFSEVIPIIRSFNLSDILPLEKVKHYSAVMTHAKIDNDDESIILQNIEKTISVYSPEEINDDTEIYEGSKKSITVNAYERDPVARRKCLDKYGYSCKICNFNFEKAYGEIGKNYIHVHHLTPLSLIKSEYKINPINDLIPVCPNCHSMLHKTNPPLKPNELREIYNERLN